MESGEVVLYNMSGKEYGAYKMNINNDESMWCADVNESLPYGNYKIKATALDDTGKEATAPAKLKVQMKQKPLKLNIDEPYQTNDTNPQICGTSNHELDNGIVFLENQYGERYGDYIMQIDNEELRWCADVSDPLPYDDYKVIATAKDPDNRKAFTKSKLKVDEKEGPFTINIDPMDSTSNTMPKICGTSSNKNIRSGVILLEHLDGTKYGYYTMDINRSNSTWCAKVKDRLKYGDYKIEAIALDNKNKQANDNAKTKIKKELSNKKVFVGLYDALMDEFEDDFEPWMAEIDEDSLTFRFKNPTIIFKRAKKDIRREFQLILNDFFPRYIRVLKRYKVQIEYVSVEGHTSSEYRLAKTYAEKYRLNQILSQKRADEVLNHLTNISNPEVMSDIIWILNTFKAQGMSSSQLVYNADGSENKILSRRVEFRIQAKENSK
jgi:outer membrane protein OmpA-like peptidoglycan-associated protein